MSQNEAREGEGGHNTLAEANLTTLDEEARAQTSTSGARLRVPPLKSVPTLAEVAHVAGVSQMTASRALNNRPGVSEKRREEILRIADELGYVVNLAAQKLSSGPVETRIIGVVAQLHTPFTSELLLGIGSVARAAGYEMLVYSLTENDSPPPVRIVELLQQIADGVIAILPYRVEYLAQLSARHIPVVTIDRTEEETFPSVTSDSKAGARAAMQHLASLGHQRIAYIGGNERLESARDRLSAVREIIPLLGLDPDPALLVSGDFMHKGGYDAATQLLALREPPTAIFAANDSSAVGAIAALREAGLRVPEDVSVIGFDDIPLASELRPQLSTVRQPLPQMARAAVNMLLAMIAHLDPPSDQITLPTQLMLRGSTALRSDALAGKYPFSQSTEEKSFS